MISMPGQQVTGLVDTAYKRITKKGIEHRHFRIPKGLLALPGMQKEDEYRLLKRILGGVQFVVIGIAGLVPPALRTANVRMDPGSDSDADLSLTGALVMGLLIVVIGLVAERIYVHGKKVCGHVPLLARHEDHNHSC